MLDEFLFDNELNQQIFFHIIYLQNFLVVNSNAIKIGENHHHVLSEVSAIIFFNQSRNLTAEKFQSQTKPQPDNNKKEVSECCGNFWQNFPFSTRIFICILKPPEFQAKPSSWILDFLHVTVKVDPFWFEYFQKLEIFVWWRHLIHPLSPQGPQQKKLRVMKISSYNKLQFRYHHIIISMVLTTSTSVIIKLENLTLPLLLPRELYRKRNGILNWLSRLSVPKVMQVKPAQVIQIEICHSLLSFSQPNPKWEKHWNLRCYHWERRTNCFR